MGFNNPAEGQTQFHSALTFQNFGAKADFTRIVASISSGGSTVTSTSGTFDNSDIGKYICIKQARANAAYSDLKYTLTAKITGYTNSSTVTIDHTADFAVSSGDAYFFTDNYAAIQDAIDFCNQNNIGLLHGGGSAPFGVCPKVSTTYSSQTTKGFNINGSLTLSDATIKWCVEDDVNVNRSNNCDFAGFVLMSDGDYLFENCMFIAPDRLRTEYVMNNNVCIKQKAGATIKGNLRLSNTQIVGDIDGGNTNYDIQWGLGVLVDADTDSTYFNTYYNEVVIQAGMQGTSIFDSFGAYKTFKATNYLNVNCGSPLIRANYLTGKANLTNGSSTLTITGASGFSFYDMTSQGLKDRAYSVSITDGVHTYSGDIVTITSPTTAVLSVAASNDITNGDMIAFPDNPTEGHCAYIHPNVALEVVNIKVQDCVGWDWHVYGSGNPGDAEYRNYTQCNTYNSGRWGYDSRGWLVCKSNTTNPCYIRDCNYMPLYTRNTESEIIAEAVNFGSDVVFYTDTSLRNCTVTNQFLSYGGTLTCYYCICDTFTCFSQPGNIVAYNCTYNTIGTNTTVINYLDFNATAIGTGYLDINQQETFRFVTGGSTITVRPTFPGQIFRLHQEGAGTTTIQMLSGTIDGNPSATLTNGHENVSYIWDGTNAHSLSKN